MVEEEFSAGWNYSDVHESVRSATIKMFYVRVVEKWQKGNVCVSSVETVVKIQLIAANALIYRGGSSGNVRILLVTLFSGNFNNSERPRRLL